MDFFARQMKRKAGHVAHIPRTMSSLGNGQNTKRRKAFERKGKQSSF
jgi:hypothetical protein